MSNLGVNGSDRLIDAIGYVTATGDGKMRINCNIQSYQKAGADTSYKAFAKVANVRNRMRHFARLIFHLFRSKRRLFGGGRAQFKQMHRQFAQGDAAARQNVVPKKWRAKATGWDQAAHTIAQQNLTRIVERVGVVGVLSKALGDCQRTIGVGLLHFENFYLVITRRSGLMFDMALISSGKEKHFSLQEERGRMPVKPLTSVAPHWKQ